MNNSLKFNCGDCTECGRETGFLPQPRTCEKCRTYFEIVCEDCAAGVCTKCGGILRLPREVFPNSLFVAISSGEMEEVERLARENAEELNVVFDWRDQLFHPLAKASRFTNARIAFSMCKTLLENGASARTKSKEKGRTALTLMAWYPKPFHKKVAGLLSSSVNDQDDYGKTALMYASGGRGRTKDHQGSVDIINCLIELGADTSIKDKANRTALDLAEESNDFQTNGDVVSLLKQVVKTRQSRRH